MIPRLKSICFLLLIIIGCSEASTARAKPLELSEWKEFYTSYYQKPQPSQLPSALEYYLQISKQPAPPDESSNKPQQAAYSRFFAALMPLHPELLRESEKAFLSADWRGKLALLEIYKRVIDDQLRVFLNQRILAEADDDKRIAIEQAYGKETDATFPASGRPVRNLSELEELWAYFYATGNPAVVQTSIDLLSNTLTSFARIDGVSLDQWAMDLLTQRALKHPVIMQTLFSCKNLGKTVLIHLGCQAIQERNLAVAQEISRLAEPLFRNSPEWVFYQGALACFENQDVGPWLQKLSSQDEILFDWLQGYQIWNQYLILKKQTKKWVKIDFNAKGRPLLRQSAGLLNAKPELIIFETWTIHKQGETSYQVNGAFQRLIRKNNVFVKVVDIQLFPKRAWLGNREKLWCWVYPRHDWVDVGNRLLMNKVRNAAGGREILQLLSSLLTPKNTRCVISENSLVQRFTVNGDFNFMFLRNVIAEKYPKHTVKTTEIVADIDPTDGRIISMKFHFEISLHGQEIAQGTLTRYFNYSNKIQYQNLQSTK